MNKKSNTGIGLRIKSCREALGLSQEQLSNRIGCNARTTVNKVEMGFDNLTYERIERFAEALNVNPAVLTGWSRQSPSYTAEEKRLLKAYRSADDDTKNMIKQFLKYAEKRNED